MTEEDTFLTLKYQRTTVDEIQIGRYVIRSAVYYVNDDGLLHRDGDLPAVINTDGSQHWFINGFRHRDDDQPAAIYTSESYYNGGHQYWFINGELHRDNNQPAVIYGDGSKEWYVGGKCVRVWHAE